MKPVKVEVDVTSSAVEKGIDTAKSFLSKLIGPAVEETGLLIKESIAFYRLKNQISVLNKAKVICERNDITPKAISLKLLCPLLDGAALEDSEVLQDKWAVLLSNLVDSDQNIDNHVFPYILSQISSNEFSILDDDCNDHVERIKKKEADLDKVLENTQHQKDIYDDELDQYRIQRDNLKRRNPGDIIGLSDLSEKIRRVHNLRYDYTADERMLWKQITEDFPVSHSKFERFELENLIRLCLVKEDKDFFSKSKTIEVPGSFYGGANTIDLDLDLDFEVSYLLTRLGYLFLRACKEKG